MATRTDGDVAGPGWAESIPPGTALLIAGEPMVGKREVLYAMLAANRGPTGGTVVVTTSELARTVLREYRRIHPDQADGLLTVVDAVGVDEPPGTRRLNTLFGPFDGLVEIRDDGRREVRVSGTDLGPDDWTPI